MAITRGLVDNIMITTIVSIKNHSVNTSPGCKKRYEVTSNLCGGASRKGKKVQFWISMGESRIRKRKTKKKNHADNKYIPTLYQTQKNNHENAPNVYNVCTYMHVLNANGHT